MLRILRMRRCAYDKQVTEAAARVHQSEQAHPVQRAPVWQLFQRQTGPTQASLRRLHGAVLANVCQHAVMEFSCLCRSYVRL
jgi:hypothetical protein